MDRALIEYIAQAYATKGSCWYGRERVTQLEHALQCASLAEQEGAGNALIAASLLHDVGHLMDARGETTSARVVDDRHEYRPIHTLRRHFGDAVLVPIRMHVAAKRYLCAVQAEYRNGLSSASQESLALQGGPFRPAEAKDFIRQPYAWDAVRLRMWDDLAKVPGRVTPPLDHYLPILMRCAREPADTQGQT